MKKIILGLFCLSLNACQSDLLNNALQISHDSSSGSQQQRISNQFSFEMDAPSESESDSDESSD